MLSQSCFPSNALIISISAAGNNSYTMLSVSTFNGKHQRKNENMYQHQYTEAKSCFREDILLTVLRNIIDACFQKQETNRSLLLKFVS